MPVVLDEEDRDWLIQCLCASVYANQVERRPLIYSIYRNIEDGDRLIDSIDYAPSATTAATLLIQKLCDYGRVDEKTEAIALLLEHLRQHAPIGVEQQQKIDALFDKYPLVKPTLRDPAQHTLPPAPYPGLRPFTGAEHLIFHGRDTHILTMLELLKRQRFLAIVGVSGCGKSSLIRAGLLPLLKSGWRIAEMRPGRTPLTELAQAMYQLHPAGALSHEDLLPDLRKRSGLTTVLRRCPLRGEERVLIFVDQFEEVFESRRSEDAAAREAAKQFVARLIESAQTAQKGTLPVSVLLTMRSDFLGDCALFPGLPELLNDSIFLPPHLSSEQLEAAIVEPLRSFHELIDKKLRKRLIEDASEETDPLPVLQHALMRIREKAIAREFPDGQAVVNTENITLYMEDYNAVAPDSGNDRLGQAIHLHAEEIYDQLTDEQKRIAEAMFRRMSERESTAANARTVRRPATVEEIAEVAHTNVESVAAVADIFRAPNRSFLMPSPAAVPHLTAGSRLDIAHEALLRHWKRLGEWTDAEARAARYYRIVRDAALRHQTASQIEWDSTAGRWQTVSGGFHPDSLFPVVEVDRVTEVLTDVTALLCPGHSTALEPLPLWAGRYAADERNKDSEFPLALAYLRESRAEIERKEAERAAEQQRRLQDAEERLRLAEEQVRLSKRMAYISDMNLVQAAYDARPGQTNRVQSLLERNKDFEERRFEWGYWNRLCNRELLTLQGHSDSVWSVALSSDGTRIVTGSNDKTAKVWDAQSGRELLTLQGHSDSVWSVALSSDGTRIVTGSADNTAKVWDAQSGRELLTLEGHGREVNSVALSSDGTRIVTGSDDRTAKVWDAQSGRELLTLEGHGGWVRSVAMSSDGTRIVTGSNDKTAKVWDAQSGRELLTLEGHSDRVWSVALSSDGTRIVTGSNDKTAKVWDAQSGRELLTLEGHGREVNSVALSSDGTRIVTGSDDNTAKVWDAQSGRELLTLEGHGREVNSVALSSDGTRIVTGSDDNTAKVWDAQSGRELLTLEGHGDEINAVAISSDGTRIVTGSDDRTAKVWDAQSGRELLTLEGHGDEINAVAISSDGTRIVTGSDDRTAKVWDAQSGRELLTLEGHGGWVRSVAMSSDGTRIVTGSDDRTAKVWDAQSGRELLTLEGHGGWVRSVAMSSDGTRIVTGSSDNTAKVWDAQSGRELLTLEGHGGWVRSVAMSSDGTRIVTGSNDKTAKVWDAQSGRELLTLEGHSDRVWSVALSSDGTRIVTGSNDKTAKVWDAQSGRELLTLEGHGDEINAVAISSDGTRIVTGSSDNTAKVWDAQSGRELLTLEGHSDRVWSVALSSDGTRIVTGSGDETAKVWGARTERELPAEQTPIAADTPKTDYNEAEAIES